MLPTTFEQIKQNASQEILYKIVYIKWWRISSSFQDIWLEISDICARLQES